MDSLTPHQTTTGSKFASANKVEFYVGAKISRKYQQQTYGGWISPTNSQVSTSSLATKINMLLLNFNAARIVSSILAILTVAPNSEVVIHTSNNHLRNAHLDFQQSLTHRKRENSSSSLCGLL